MARREDRRSPLSVDPERREDARKRHRDDEDLSRDKRRRGAQEYSRHSSGERNRGRDVDRRDGSSRARSPRRNATPPRRSPSRREELQAVIRKGEKRAQADALAPLPPTTDQATAAAAAPKPLGKAGGVYIPPFKLAQLMAAEAAKDRAGAQFQRLTWDALRKSINALVNKVTKANIKSIVQELFNENLIRGKGLLCRSLLRSQIASPSYTPVFAALVTIINCKLPDIGALLVTRLILQFKRSLRRNDRALCVPATIFLAHLVNQQVAEEILAYEVIHVLLADITDDTIEIAVNMLKQCGAHLEDTSRPFMIAAMDELRKIVAESQVEQRTTFMVEELMRVRREGFEKSGFPAVEADLDLVETEDRVTHKLDLDDENLKAQTELDIFREDADYEKHEEDWQAMKREILGEEEDEDDASGEDGAEEEDESDSEASDQEAAPMEIQDQTETNVINLRRTIYLTIMSALDFEEAGHKLMKIELQEGQEKEIVLMIIECCSQEKTYLNYYGLLGQRFSMLHQKWQALFEDCFQRQYALIHRLETNKLRNVAKFFAHLLYTDAISWAVLSSIHLTEDDTTSSSRIFIKILFQEMAENMGLAKLNARLQDPLAAPWVAGIFPRDTPRNMRFSINFFTSIGLGGLTDAMRAHLKELPKLILAQQQAAAAAQAGGSSSSNDSSSSSSDDSSSDDSSSGSSSDSSSSSDDSSSSSSSDDSSSDDEPPAKSKARAMAKAKQPSAPASTRELQPEELPGPPPRPRAVTAEDERPARQAQENGNHSRAERSERDRRDRRDPAPPSRSRHQYVERDRPQDDSPPRHRHDDRDHPRRNSPPRRARRSPSPARRSRRSASPRRSRRDRD